MYNTSIMGNVDYLQVIRDSCQELKQRVTDRERTDKRINELRIALRALVRFMPEDSHRQEILQLVKDAKRRVPSLTESVLALVSQNTEGISSAQIREQLDEAGFDLDEYSQPLATIMSTLQRLVDSGKVKRDLDAGDSVIFKPPHIPTWRSPERKKLDYQGDKKK